MFKFRRNKNRFVTVRVEDLQIADRFVYDNVACEVLDIIQGRTLSIVRLGSTHPGSRQRTRQVDLHHELFMTVAR